MFRHDTRQATVTADAKEPARQRLGPGLSPTNGREVISLIEEAQRIGLCVTCDHAPTCYYRHAQTGPVQFCEEFA